MVLEEVREFQATVLVATLTGFLLGGLVGARYAGDKFVAISHSSKFSSTMQAQVCTAYVYTMFVCIFIHMQCFPQDKRRGGGGGGGGGGSAPHSPFRDNTDRCVQNRNKKLPK